MSLAPITVFVYNRPWHIKQTIEALKKNKLSRESELFIFSDGPKDEKDRKKVEEVRKYIKKINGFKKITITERQKNLGLANSIITGVTEIINIYGKIIVLEDDLLTSPYFLKFMNGTLEFYKNNRKIACIHGYTYPVKNKLPETFFLRDPGCWGWATWKRGWNLYERDGSFLLRELQLRKITTQFNYRNSYPFTNMLKNQINGSVDSWAIRWYGSVFLKNKLTLYPGKSLVFHNGSDGSGTHGGISDKYVVELSNQPIKIKDIPTEDNSVVLNEYIRYFRSIQTPLILKVGKKVLRSLYKILNHKK